MEKVQWNSINIKQNGLKYSKNDKSSTLPRKYYLTNLTLHQGFLKVWRARRTEDNLNCLGKIQWFYSFLGK